MDGNEIARQRAVQAVLTMHDVKNVTEAFDLGELNVFAALTAIARLCEPYREVELGRREVG